MVLRTVDRRILRLCNCEVFGRVGVAVDLTEEEENSSLSDTHGIMVAQEEKGWKDLREREREREEKPSEF